MKNAFLDAMRARFACKSFDPTKEISLQDFEEILEAGRLTPSSFGLEPTRILVIENKALRKEMQSLCWNQTQITDSSKLVVLTSKVLDMDHRSNYVNRMISRKVKDPEALVAYSKRYGTFLANNDYKEAQSIYHWTSKQAYLIASSMMNCASFLHIDSCPIEGFEKKPLEKLLGLDPFSEQISLLIAFGYHAKKPEKRAPRLSKHEFVKYL